VDQKKGGPKAPAARPVRILSEILKPPPAIPAVEKAA